MIIPKGTVVTIDGKVYRTLEAQVAWNKEELESLDIETLEGLPDAFEELDNKVDGIDDRLETAEGDIVDIKGDVQDLDQDINGTGGIEDRLTTAEENISTSAGDISQLQYDLGQAQTDIGSLYNTKMDKPLSAGTNGEVLVKVTGGTDWQAVAPFDPNGTYPGVTVGKAVSAKSLENVSEDSGADQDEPFFFQATATANNTAETPTAPTFELRKLKGNTIVYNQLVDGVNLTYATISGHKYWCYISATDYTSIITSSGTSINVSDAQKDKLVDLTRWFNGSIPQAILDDPLVFPINYYDDDLTYSAGELKNCSCTELKTVGFNQWDEEWELGSLDASGQPISSSNTIRSKNFIKIIPGYDYYYYQTVGGDHVVCYYDSNKDFISRGISNSAGHLLSIPSGTRYIKFRKDSTTTYSGGICINLSWDGERDGTYEPYTTHTYPMVWSGKSAGGSYAGLVADTLAPDGTLTTKIGTKDLGTLSWVKYSDGHFYATVSGAKSGASCICAKYYSNLNGSTIMSNNTIAFNSAQTNVYLSDSDFTTIEQVASALSGVMLYYELATPTTSSGDAYTSVIEGDDYGNMEFDSVVPVGNEFFYPADYALLIDDLNNYVNGDVTELAKKSDLIPAPTGGDGTYVFKATVSGGTVTYFWEAES